MSEVQDPQHNPSVPEVARVYARPQPDQVDELLGTPFSHTPIPLDLLQQAAQDTARYLETRPATPEDVPDSDTHYYATLGVPHEQRPATELIEEWAAAEAEEDRTRAKDMQEELMGRALRRSLTHRGTPYARPNARQAERPAHTFNALFDRKERIKQQQAAVAPSAATQSPAPPGPKPWLRAKTAFGNTFYGPEHANRRMWLAAGAVGLSYVAGAASMYAAIRYGGIGLPPNTSYAPPPGTEVPPYPLEAPRINVSLAGNNHTIWAAEQGLHPGWTDTQINQDILGEFAILKAHGWQAGYWQDPSNPNIWGFSDTFVAPKDQYLYFPDGHIEHLSGQVYSGTDGTFGALEYANKYAHAQEISEAQARLLSGVPNVGAVGLRSFVLAGNLQMSAPGLVPVETLTTAPVAYAEQHTAHRGAAVAVPMFDTLVFMAYNQAWAEELRQRNLQIDEEDED